MRKAFIILTGMLFTLLFASCNQFTANIDDYLSYWASEAYITDSSIKAVLQNDLNSIPSVPSAEDVSVTFKLKNPKSFSLDLPPAADPAKKVIVFEHLTQAPVVGTDYTLTQSEDRQSLTLTYKASFLQAYEWGAQDLSSTLSLYAVDGRPFKQTYTLKLKANTPPQNPSFTVAKTTGSSAYYVLCITIPDMDKRVPGGLLHKDLVRIEVNGTPYTFSVNEAQTAFTKPEADVFITHSDVAKLSEPDADEVPTDGWVLYYKTDVEVKDGAVKKDYTVRLVDAQGLVSGILNASTKPNKAENETIRITKGTKISGSGSEAAPIVIGTDNTGAELSVSSATANTTVHCTVSEIDGSTPVQYDGNPVTVPLALNGAGEKKYKLEYYTDGEGLAATPVQTVYYKVVQGHTVSYRVDGEHGKIQAGSDSPAPSGAVSVVHGGSVTFTAQPDEANGWEVDSWSGNVTPSSDKKQATLSNVTGDTAVTVKFKKKTYTVTFSVVGGNGTLTAEVDGSNIQSGNKVEHGKNITFTATPTDSSQYKVGDWTCTPSEGFTGQSGQPTAALTVTADTTVSVQFVQLNALIPSKLEIHGVDAVSTDSITLPYTKAKVTQSDITLEFSGHTDISFTVTPTLPLTLMAGTPQNITINVAASPGNYPAWLKTVSITRAKNSVAELQSFTLNGETKTAASDGSFASEYEVASDQAEVTDCVVDPATSEGATASVSPAGSEPIPVSTGKKFTITVTAQDGTQSTVTFTVKRKKYDVNYLVEIVDGEAGGKIKADSGNFVENGSTSVEYGGSVGFTAVPTNTDWKVAEWKKDNTVVNGTNSTYTLSNITENKEVTVKFYQSHISSPETWKDLLRAVKSAPDNSTITINGEIKATNDEGNKGIINIRKRLTIKGNNPSAALNADSKSGIFDVFNTLTLENITLTKGAAFYYQSGGAGVYVNPSGTLIMEGSSVITDCSAANSGGGVYVGGGTFEMHGTSAITGCTASKGGGVYVSGGTFKMQDSAIVTPSTGSEQYTAVKNDVYLESGKMITINGTLTGTTPVARITVPNTAYDTSTQVLTDAITTGSPQNYTKFTVTPQDVTVGSENGKMFWYITAAGTLKAEVEDLQTLKETVQAAPADNTPFIIKLAGTISIREMVQIPNGKKITLKADASKPAILKCSHNWQMYTYFDVQSGASLTLEGQITLQGVDFVYAKQHYALYVNHNGNAEIKDGVTITGFKNSDVTTTGGVKYSGKGPVFVDGTLTMSGGTIKENTVGNGATMWLGGGGGVYVGATGNFIMKGGTITQNKASGYNTSNGGSGVYVKGQFTMEGGTIEENKEAYAGGGVLVGGGGVFNMKGGKITKNKSNRGKGVMVRGDSDGRATFDWQDGEIIDNEGTGNAVVTKGDVNFDNHGHTAS